MFRFHHSLKTWLNFLLCSKNSHVVVDWFFITKVEIIWKSQINKLLMKFTKNTLNFSSRWSFDYVLKQLPLLKDTPVSLTLWIHPTGHHSGKSSQKWSKSSPHLKNHWNPVAENNFIENNEKSLRIPHSKFSDIVSPYWKFHIIWLPN